MGFVTRFSSGMDPTKVCSDDPSNDSAFAHVAPHRWATALAEYEITERIRN